MGYQIINPGDFDFSALDQIPLAQRTAGSPGRKNQKTYINCCTAFDIEVTNYKPKEVGVMYVWQWYFEGIGVVMGRTWEDHILFTDRLNKYLMKRDTRLICFVHNLSYEMSWLKGIYTFADEDVFMVDTRKFVKAALNRIDFRCSYFLTNMSLDSFTHKMGVEHGKLSGVQYDYNKERFPWTPLSDYEVAYCCNDVIGLVEAIRVQMARDGDTFYSLPLTSTGYCRRDANRVLRSVSWKLLQDLKCTDVEYYTICKEAFRGGNCHANRAYSGGIVYNVHSWDRASSYPDVICNMKYPMSYFTKKDNPTWDDVAIDIKRGKALLLRIRAWDVHLKDEWCPCPYLSFNKCRSVPSSGLELDNGRILKARYLETTLTDIDYKIFSAQYDGEVEVVEMWRARYGYLPKVYVRLVQEYFRRKTELKGDKDQKLYYDLAKALLNSLYGLMAQDPGRQDILYDDTERVGRYKEAKDEGYKDLQARLDAYNKRAYLPYVWGVWVTSWARYWLQRAIDLVGDDFVYTDTDSVKFVGDHTADMEKLNAEIRATSEASGSYAKDRKGITHYMGVYEYEETYPEFITQGAKKYLARHEEPWTDPDGNEHYLECTIAGVNKVEGVKEIEAAGGMAAFTPDFLFKKAGGLAVRYNDDYFDLLQIDGHEVFIGDNVYLYDDTYQLGYTHSYEQLLQFIENSGNKKSSSYY